MADCCLVCAPLPPLASVSRSCLPRYLDIRAACFLGMNRNETRTHLDQQNCLGSIFFGLLDLHAVFSNPFELTVAFYTPQDIPSLLDPLAIHSTAISDPGFRIQDDKPVDGDPRARYTNQWGTGMMNAPVANPMGCCAALLCPCPMSMYLRYLVLEKDVSKYVCCQVGLLILELLARISSAQRSSRLSATLLGSNRLGLAGILRHRVPQSREIRRVELPMGVHGGRVSLLFLVLHFLHAHDDHGYPEHHAGPVRQSVRSASVADVSAASG